MTDDFIMILIVLSIGLTCVGLFSKYKIFLLLSIGSLLALSYEFGGAEFDGHMIIATSFIGWMLFNSYLAFQSDSND